jgi:hypothetical protein
MTCLVYSLPYFFRVNLKIVTEANKIVPFSRYLQSYFITVVSMLRIKPLSMLWATNRHLCQDSL